MVKGPSRADAAPTASGTPPPNEEIAISPTDSDNSLNVCIVMPVLDEQDNLSWLLPRLKAKYDLLVVDNGSTDDSVLVCQRHGVAVISQAERGYGAAIAKAAEHLHDNDRDQTLMVIFDADGTSPLEAIPRLIAPITEGECDLVLGQRTTQQKGAMPWHARVGNGLTTLLIGLSTGRYFLDMGPLRALKVETLRDLNMTDRNYGWNVEMQMKAVHRGVRIEEIGVTYARRRFGRSKISGSILGSIRAAIKILYRVGYFHVQLRRTPKLPATQHRRSGQS